MSIEMLQKLWEMISLAVAIWFAFKIIWWAIDAVKQQHEREGPREVVVVNLDGRTERQRVLDESYAWMQEKANENTPTPSREYLLVRDLRILVMGKRSKI